MTDQVLEGAEEAIRKLAKISDRVVKRVVTKSVRAGGAPFVKAVKRNTPTETKTLKKSIRQKVKTYRNSGAVVSITGARNKKLANGRNPAKYLHLVEQGTHPHDIRPKVGRVLFVKGQFAAVIHHPGSKGVHLIQRAQRSARGKSVAGFKKKFHDEVEKEARTA